MFTLLLLAPMLLGAQLILTLVLLKGDICLGQRGRIHKVLPIIAILWGISAFTFYPEALVGIMLLYFFSQVKTKKTREQGPLWALWLAGGLALLSVGYQVVMQEGIGRIAIIVMIPLLGSAFAHLLLTVARTRLQAFHRILPFTGIIAAMLVAITILLHAYSLDETMRTEATQLILAGMVLMLVAIAIWCWHIFTYKTANRMQLLIMLVLMLASATTTVALFSL